MSYDYIRMLIDAGRYKSMAKSYWGGADVIFVTYNEYTKHADELDNWDKSSRSHQLVKTDDAPAVIWLIETLKPYVDIDYISKYDYYRTIAERVESGSKLNKVSLLNAILDAVDKYEKHIYAEPQLKDWYEYGRMNGDPFFVKFMALWIAFNKEYSKYESDGDEYEGNGSSRRSERAQITEFCRRNKRILIECYNDVFDSKLVEVFMLKPIMDMRTNPPSVSSGNEYNYKDLTISFHDFRSDRRNNISWASEKTESIYKERRTIALFQSLYSVRCNLFHGSKNPECQRDIDLVRCSGEILEIYLDHYYEAKNHNRRGVRR